MKTNFRQSAFLFLFFSILFSVVQLPLFANAAEKCAWIFSPKSMVLDKARELSANPHSAYYIGQKVSEERLRTIIEEISGEKALDSKGCIQGRCSDKDKVRVREYLSKKMKDLKVPVYYEYSRANAVSADPTYIWFLRRTITSDRFNTFKYFLRFTKFGFKDSDVLEIDLPFLQELAKNLQFPPHPDTPIFEATFGELRHSPFLNQPLLKERLLRELKEIASEIERENERASERAKLQARKAEPPEIVNVIAEIQGTKYPDTVLEVSAHYDSVFESAPGADDNGSGVSAMLEMIRIFKKHPPERTIRFIFTDLEERGMKGSKLHVHNLLTKKERVLPALIIDTIGYHPKRYNGRSPVYVLELGDQGMHQSRHSYEQAKALVEAIAWQSNRYHRDVRFSVQHGDALPGLADYGSYIRRGLPAVLAAAGFHGDLVNPGYHTPKDTIDKYNWPFFLSITRVLTETVAIVSGARLSDKEYRAITTEQLHDIDSKLNPNAENEPLLTKIHNDGVGEYRDSTSSVRAPSHRPAPAHIQATPPVSRPVPTPPPTRPAQSQSALSSTAQNNKSNSTPKPAEKGFFDKAVDVFFFWWK